MWAFNPFTGTLDNTVDASGFAKLDGATFTGDISAPNLSGINTGDQDLSGLIVKARIQFDGLNGFTTTVSRRGRTKIAKTTTTWEMTADASGSASVTIKKASYSNLPSTLTTIGTITLTTAQKATGSLSVALDAGDYLIFELTSCSGINELLVELF